VRTFFAGKRLEVVYHNPEGLAFGEYRIGDVFVNGSPWDSSLTTHSVVFKREDVIGWPEHNKILVALVAL
jgi:hypothetical protein